jgi:hypothetical protein
MKAQDQETDSIVGLRVDLVTAAHIYFFDRYQPLAACYRRRGHHARARRLQAKADEHYALGGGDGPPYAAAMGMPRPRQWFSTNVVSRSRFRGPDDAA